MKKAGERSAGPIVSQTNVSVILPTYNEQGNIVPLVRQLKGLLADTPKEIIVVDDDSPDGTAQQVRDAFAEDGEVRLIVRYENRGLANSIREGIENASGDVIIVMDSDGNHRPEDVVMLLHVASNVDIVVGSRFIYGGGMSNLFHYYLSYLFNIFIRLVTGSRLDDNLSGFFSIHREKLFALDFDRIFWGYGDYFFRLLLLCQRHGFRFVEVPVFYGERKHDTSKTSFFLVFVRYTSEVLRLILLRLLNK
ncbi:MAG: glycosyltransferase [Alphaproteobacteria bacterium]|nr:glycosyltransferase [Alphaproteobacteria bacterium]